uniref:Uncharacterized protein n=1 Tax=Knipowitschia caucasica TaxID=637954 RepID=A0AAV2M8H9_KNICA
MLPLLLLTILLNAQLFTAAPINQELRIGADIFRDDAPSMDSVASVSEEVVEDEEENHLQTEDDPETKDHIVVGDQTIEEAKEEPKPVAVVEEHTNEESTLKQEQVVVIEPVEEQTSPEDATTDNDDEADDAVEDAVDVFPVEDNAPKDSAEPEVVAVVEEAKAEQIQGDAITEVEEAGPEEAEEPAVVEDDKEQTIVVAVMREDPEEATTEDQATSSSRGNCSRGTNSYDQPRGCAGSCILHFGFFYDRWIYWNNCVQKTAIKKTQRIVLLQPPLHPPFSADPKQFLCENMALSGGTVETVDEVPPHVWAGLPDYLSLGHSHVNQNRIGVWTTQLIPKGRKFGPFVGEKKKRSQVTSNVYMWEVHFPSRGWMCVDATDPLKGNWLRYVNWARSSEEQNLFPLEINRAIYYKALRPIGPGEELLVWYSHSVQDKPEVTAALKKEQRGNNKTKSARVKRARRKLPEKASPAGLGGFEKVSTTELSAKEMWDGDEGGTEEDQRSSIEIQEAHAIARMNYGEVERVMSDRGNGREDEEEEQMEEDGDELEEHIQQKDAQYSFVQGQPRQSVTSTDTNKESHSFNRDPQGSYPCHQCERHFSTKQGLERHLHIHATSNQPAQVFKCSYAEPILSLLQQCDFANPSPTCPAHNPISHNARVSFTEAFRVDRTEPAPRTLTGNVT